MPFYEYKCSSCSVITEQETSIHEVAASTVACKSCGKNATRKFSNFSAVFRGGGWGGSK